MSTFFGPRVGERIRNPEKLIGLVLCGDYPEHNFQGVPSGYEPRRVYVEGYRDTRKEPIEKETVKVDPRRRRSRFLLVGRDLDKGETRHFYLGRFRTWCAQKATPDVLFPDQHLEASDGKKPYFFATQDQRMYLAKAHSSMGMSLYPVSRATFLASESLAVR